MAKDNKLIQGETDPQAEGIRENRAVNDRLVSEDRETTDKLRVADRLAMLENVDTVLPKPPRIPGWHTCWLSTTNTQDSLERRFSLGYELVSPDELPGWAFPTQKSSQAVSRDRIIVNEMVLGKLPEELYYAYLKRSHHTRPLEQEASISADNVISKMKDGRGRPIGVIEGEGHKELARPRKADFSGVMDGA